MQMTCPPLFIWLKPESRLEIGASAPREQRTSGLKRPRDRCPRSSLSVASVVWPGRSCPCGGYEGGGRLFPVHVEQRRWGSVAGASGVDVRPRGVCGVLHAARRALGQHGGPIVLVASFGGNGPSPPLVAAPSGLGRCTLSPRLESRRAPCRRDERHPYPPCRVRGNGRRRPRGRARSIYSPKTPERRRQLGASCRRRHASS